MTTTFMKTAAGALLLATSLAGCGSAGPTYQEQRVAARLDNRGEYLEDQGISSKVAAAFVAEPRFRDADIHVATVDNMVTLSGYVRNGSDIGFAEDVALGVEGVRGVNNVLTVR
ncbi:MAG: BON domain-containing protein [Rhodospirillaceae bacterium]